MQAKLWVMAGAAATVAIAAILADRRRASRPDPDRPGWVPWPLVLLIAILTGAVCAAFAVRG